MFEKIDRTKIENRIHNLVVDAYDEYIETRASEGVEKANKIFFMKMLNLDAQRDTCHMNADSADRAINSLIITVNMG